MGSFKLEAKTIYSGIHSMTGISEGTLNAALNGDLSAADQILKYNENIVRQAEIADTVITAINDGMEAHGRLIEAQASFLKQASSTITTATKAMTGVNQANLKLGHATTEILQEDKLKQNQLIQNHKRKICLLPQEYATQETVADINFRQKRYQLVQQVNEARDAANNDKKQLTPRQQSMENLREVTGNAGKVGSGVGSWLGGIFNGLFGA
jgi:hypothetical protein